MRDDIYGEIYGKIRGIDWKFQLAAVVVAPGRSIAVAGQTAAAADAVAAP